MKDNNLKDDACSEDFNHEEHVQYDWHPKKRPDTDEMIKGFIRGSKSKNKITVKIAGQADEK